jgi:hypothetical protein
VAATNAARTISFIGILHLWSGEMSGFDEGYMGVCRGDEYAAVQLPAMPSLHENR